MGPKSFRGFLASLYGSYMEQVTGHRDEPQAFATIRNYQLFIIIRH